MADDVSLKKRAQISKANRTMFLWIAAASILLGAAVVMSYFMVKIALYKEAVLSAKGHTSQILSKNLDAVEPLKGEIRALDANEDLASSKARDTDQALQVVLDALPSEANSLALGASLQNKLLLAGDSNVTLESIQVDPVVGVETDVESDTVDAGSSDSSENGIGFQFVVKGSSDSLRVVLANLERSIRTIQVTSVQISGDASGQTMSVQGRAFYEPAKHIQLHDEVVPRGGKK